MRKGMEMVLSVVTVLRILAASLLASLGVSILLGWISYVLFEVRSPDIFSLASLLAFPFAYAAICLLVAYWLCRNLSRFHKFIIVVITFVLSIVFFIASVSDLGWFSQALGGTLRSP